jgi:hypothetical protein
MPSAIEQFAAAAASKITALRDPSLPPFPTVSNGYTDADLTAMVRLLAAVDPDFDSPDWRRNAADRILGSRYGSTGFADFLFKLDNEIFRALTAGCDGFKVGLLDCGLFDGSEVFVTDSLAGVLLTGKIALGLIRGLPDDVRNAFTSTVGLPIAGYGEPQPCIVLGPAPVRRWTTIEYARRSSATWAARQAVQAERAELDARLARERYEAQERKRQESYPAQLGRLLALEAKMKQLEEQAAKPAEPAKRKAKSA